MQRQRLREKRRLRKRLREIKLREGWSGRLWRALPALLVTFVMTFVFVQMDALRSLGDFGQDLQERLISPAESSEVAVVVIDAHDYEKLFDATSPLKPARLYELIGAIASGKPKVIGVDIDTSDKQFKDFPIAAGWPPVVWARGLSPLDAPPASDKPIALPVLGGKSIQPDDDLSGVAATSPVDDVTRLYQRFIETTDGTVPSFSWALVKKYDPDIETRLEADDTPRLIRFTGDEIGSHRTELAASRVLEFAREDWWGNNNLIKDKIVLLGGSYGGSGKADQSRTPLGEMYGIRIMASVAETELNGGGIKEPGVVALLPLWAFQGLILVLLFHFYPFRNRKVQHAPLRWRNVALHLMFILLLAFICSLISSRFSSYWSYFLPVALGLYIYHLLDLLNDWRKATLTSAVTQLMDDPRRKK